MITRLAVKNFKLFDSVGIELGQRVVLVGPNNMGKSTALQALTLWEAGLRKWVEKRSEGTPESRPGVTINRRDLISIPVPTAKLLWKDLHVRAVRKENGRQRTENILIEICVSGVWQGREWECGLEFDYANEESFYCRPMKRPDGKRMEVPRDVQNMHLAYLPPMSGLAAEEDRLDPGAIRVRLGEGRTAEVLRNLCYAVVQSRDGQAKWEKIVERMKKLFGVELKQPEYIAARGQIVLKYRDFRGTELDLVSSGRGQQQTLLLLAYLALRPGNILLLDEPDAHLEILRQREIYRILCESAEETQSQIIAASHSEILLNEAAGRDMVIAFVGRPHRIDDRGSQVLKALRDIGFDQYFLAEQKGWVLYLEGSSDLVILQTLAKKLGHPAEEDLQRPFVYYTGNQPARAKEHFYALREAKSDLAGIAVYDRLERGLEEAGQLKQVQWRQREIENYLCKRDVLIRFARERAVKEGGAIFSNTWAENMEEAIRETEKALETLGKPSPWKGELKVSDEFLGPLFRTFYAKLGLKNLMNKADYYELAEYLEREEIDLDVVRVLDAIHEVASQAKTAEGGIS
jgi:energy-coupling factor transporter ATP-binding protein EcfA2